MINKDFLDALLRAKSPSGDENSATQVFCDYMSGFSNFEFRDKVGNAAFSVGNGETKIMLSGHIDEIALLVQNIDDDGFVHFIKDGGIDDKAILSLPVAIITKKGIINGVIGKSPIHVEWYTDEKNKTTKVKDMKIDIGAESKEEALEMVSVGDPIVFIDYPFQMSKNRFTARGLDDKTGVYVTAEVIKRLSTMKLNNVKVFGVACTQEETSESGAAIAASRIDPQYSIDYDVTFATDDKCVDPNEWGDIKLGKGGAICYSPDCNRGFADLVKGVCEDNKIPYQAFSKDSGGTNTVFIKQCSSDCETLLLSIPNRNMHTPVEVCDYRDLESLVDMTVAAIVKIDSDLNKK